MQNWNCRALNALTVFTLMLSFVILGMWVRSYSAFDVFGWLHSKTDARYFGSYREETRVESRFHGAESVDGKMGFGAWHFVHSKTTPMTYAVQWEPRPDADGLHGYTLNPRARVKRMPFANPDTQEKRFAGFAWVTPVIHTAKGLQDSGSSPAFILPYWFLAILTGILPVLRATSWFRRSNLASTRLT